MKKDIENQPIVSVIIPTLNRSEETMLCVASVLESSYKNLEIIVVDNNSEDNTVSSLKNKFRREESFQIIESKKNLGAGGGRNLGAKHASGELLLFLDSDNIVEKSMVERLSLFISENKECGMVGPLMLYQKNPKMIWLSFADIDMFTSQAKYKGTGKNIRSIKSADPIRVGHLPNCFMVRKDDFKAAGGFDEKYLVMFEEADIAEKIKNKLGKSIILLPKAITFHDVPLPVKKGRDEYLGFRSDKRVFLTARNRIYFMRKNANFLQFLIFLLIFNPLNIIYYVLKFIQMKKFRRAMIYFRGNLAGFVL